MPSLVRRSVAELLGTFVLVFAGTGAIVVNAETGTITHPGIAITFGLVVLALIYALGDLSGAHFNPAVTLGFTAAGRFPLVEVGPYLAAQLAGACAASAAMIALFPESPTLGETLPRGPVPRSFLLELGLTWFLMLAILRVSSGAKEKGITAGIAVGSVIALEAMFAGPICGASMNPARSLGPALLAGKLEHLWLYLAGPTLGALLAVPTFRLVTPPEDVPCPA